MKHHNVFPLMYVGKSTHPLTVLTVKLLTTLVAVMRVTQRDTA